MHKISLSALVVLFSSFSFGAAIANTASLDARRKRKEVEGRLDDVFIPRVGFDNNDRVEVVLSGELPSPCFSLDRAYAEKTSDGKGFLVHQMAWQWNSGACAT